jgi:hypothetical protein
MLALTDEVVAAANAVPAGRGLTHAARTGGYVPPVLIDVFARAPYGHVGQWPSLSVMAMRDRPKRFAVDPTSLDLEHVGVQWHDGDPRGNEYMYDATVPGYDVGGHTFLADLPSSDSRAVIEYLKTL